MNKQEVYQFLKDNNIQTEDLIKILKENGNEVNIVKIWLYTLWEIAICIILFLKILKYSWLWVGLVNLAEKYF